MDSAALLSKLNLILESRLVLKAIVAGRAAHQLTALPIIEDASDVLACNAGHGGEVGLPDLLTDDDPPWPDFLPEMVRQQEQCLLGSSWLPASCLSRAGVQREA